MTSTYWQNREKIESEEFAKHRGKWIAINADGTHIIASDVSLKDLLKQVDAKGEDRRQVHVDRVVENPETLDFGAIEFE